MAYLWTTGSISRMVVEMLWAIRADGRVPTPRPLRAWAGIRFKVGLLMSEEKEANCLLT